MASYKILLLVCLTFLSSKTFSTALQPRSPQASCASCAPNPIATVYPNNVPGLINGTIAVLVVPLTYAKSLLPSKLVPLTHAYTRFGIPATHYPLVMEALIDHDIRFQGVNAVADFSILRITFPYIDLLNDNSSCFRYTSYNYQSPMVPLAVSGSETYGITVIPATFDPADAPYKCLEAGSGDYVFKVFQDASQSLGLPPAAFGRFQPSSVHKGFPLALYRNVTNQPIFGNSSTICDNQIRFWNTTVSQGPNQPENVKGVVKLSPPAVDKERIFEGVKAIRATTAFLENNYVPCGMLKGYAGTGEGDSG